MTGRDFDPRAFISWSRERWRFCALASVSAVAVTLAVSLALPRQFTATSTILIGAPAGNDPRALTAMNSVYLDSLKAWERVAGSDFIFAEALARASSAGSAPAGSVASLKKKILRVNKPAGMALLEISITLPDPKQAQKLAQTMAELTVAQSRSSDEKSATDLNGEFREQRETAAARVTEAVKARDTLSLNSPVDLLQTEVEAMAELNGKLQSEAALARADLAADLAQGKNAEATGTLARLASLEKQQQDAEKRITRASRRLEEAKNLRDNAEAELKSARAALDTANLRVNDAMSGARWRGERLRVVDPGAVPKEPSSPNVLLNVIAAFVVSLGGSILYLAFAFGLRRDTGESRLERLYSVR